MVSMRLCTPRSTSRWFIGTFAWPSGRATARRGRAGNPGAPGPPPGLDVEGEPGGVLIETPHGGRPWSDRGRAPQGSRAHDQLRRRRHRRGRRPLRAGQGDRLRRRHHRRRPGEARRLCADAQGEGETARRPAPSAGGRPPRRHADVAARPHPLRDQVARLLQARRRERTAGARLHLLPLPAARVAAAQLRRRQPGDAGRRLRSLVHLAAEGDGAFRARLAPRGAVVRAVAGVGRAQALPRPHPRRLPGGRAQEPVHAGAPRRPRAALRGRRPRGHRAAQARLSR